MLEFLSFNKDPSWRNWLARSTVNRKVGGSSPPEGEHFVFIFLMNHKLKKNPPTKDGFGILTEFAAVCFSDKILTGIANEY